MVHQAQQALLVSQGHLGLLVYKVLQEHRVFREPRGPLVRPGLRELRVQQE